MVRVYFLFTYILIYWFTNLFIHSLTQLRKYLLTYLIQAMIILSHFLAFNVKNENKDHIT